MGVIMRNEVDMDAWIPKTELGKKVKSGEITDIYYILENGYRILEPEIVDYLIPDLEVVLLEVGQSKGKFGGGKSSAWKQTQKKTKEGNVLKFSTFIAVGDRKGVVGIGFGNATETLPARQKAIRQAKLSLIKVDKGCGSWACGCAKGHSISFTTSGRCGSVVMKLMPAPMGAGLVVENKCKDILALAGIHDVYSKTKGKTSTRLNLFKACFASLKALSSVRLSKPIIVKEDVKEDKTE